MERMVLVVLTLLTVHYLPVDRLPTIPALRNLPLASLSTSPLFLRPTTTRYIPANPSSLRQNPTNFAIPLRYFVRFA